MRTVLVSVVLSLALFACGGDDDGGGGGGGDTPDASTAIDAAPPVQASGPLSQTCDPTDQNGCSMGGEACLTQPGNNVGICSVTCTDINDTTSCPPAYTGPGLPLCLLSVPGPNPGDPSQSFCAIVCQAPPEANCTTCDGTCPTGMQCGTPQNGVAICEAMQ